MKTETSIYKTLMDNIRHKKYRVNPNWNVLEIGDFIRPETVIGFQRETDVPIAAGLSGQVVSIRTTPKDESVMLMTIYTKGDRKRAFQRIIPF